MCALGRGESDCKSQVFCCRDFLPLLRKRWSGLGVGERSGFLNALREAMVRPGLVSEGQCTHSLTKHFQVEDKNRPSPQGHFFGVDRNVRNRAVTISSHTQMPPVTKVYTLSAGRLLTVDYTSKTCNKKVNTANRLVGRRNPAGPFLL